MNYTKILSRAWKILWSYRALWVFGIIVGMASGGGGSGGSGGSGGGMNSGGMNFSNQSGLFPFEIPDQFRQDLARISRSFISGNFMEVIQAWIGVVIGVFCLLILLGIMFRVAYYVSQVSLIRMVDDLENSGEKMTFKQGLRLGWTRNAWRLFLIDLVIYLPFVLGILVLIGLAAVPLIPGLRNSSNPAFGWIIISIGLFFLVIVLAVIVGVVISLIMEIIQRVCVLTGLGVMNSIRQGLQIIRKRLKDVIIMWLILIGIQIGYFVVVIPIVLILSAVGILLGGGLGLGTYFAINSVAGFTSGWIVAVIVGILLFLLVLAVPMIFINGLAQTYLSSAWTLTYREIALSSSTGPETAEAQAT